MVKVGFIDYFLDEWHANNYPAWINQRLDGKYKVCYAYGVIDSPHPGGLTNQQWSEKYGIELDEMEQWALKLLHAKTGAAIAREMLCYLSIRNLEFFFKSCGKGGSFHFSVL